MDFDVAIRGGLVFDGTGAEPVRADVGVVGDTIAAVGDLATYEAGRTVDASGRHVAPGFIDMHTHAERGLPHPELAPSVHHLKQGVTTVLGGADGYGAWPIHSSMGDLSSKLTSQGIGTNAALMVGLGQVRRQVMGLTDRRPTPGETEAMKSRIRDAMASGAVGISSGLVFAPDMHFDTDGIVDLVREAARFGGIYHTHVRDEADRLIEAVEEAIAIGERSGATTVVTHFKAVYRRNWGKLRQATDLIESARNRGVRVYADQYPFVEGGPVPLIPPETWSGSPDAVEETERLDPGCYRVTARRLAAADTRQPGGGTARPGGDCVLAREAGTPARLSVRGVGSRNAAAGQRTVRRRLLVRHAPGPGQPLGAWELHGSTGGSRRGRSNCGRGQSALGRLRRAR